MIRDEGTREGIRNGEVWANKMQASPPGCRA
jgi:hypothetical protein